MAALKTDNKTITDMKRLLGISLLALAVWSCAPKEYDVCVYGGTASGIVAADAAAKMGMKVVVVEPSCRIGGMTTGGLGRTDIGNKQVVQGLALKFYRECGKRYGNLENWVFEPKVAKEVMDEFAKSPRIKVITNRHFVKAGTENGKIISMTAAGDGDTLTFKAKWFIDASYEGDLMAGSGVSYRTGREDNSEYGETWDGSQLLHVFHQFPAGVDPFVEPGNPDSGLLWGIANRQAKPNGTGDNLIQAYNYRICLTDDPANMIPLSEPENYDPSRYELLVRLFDAQPDMRDLNQYFIWTPMPNRKTDINNRGAFSTDMIGMNYGYPEGTWEEREAIIKEHLDYTLGLLWFYVTDPRVPAELQNEVRKWGLPKDEYPENGHWTPQLYVREARRMVSAYVATQADCEGRADVTDGIAHAAYNMDSHNCERIITPCGKGKWMVENEGDVEISGGLPYPISYRSITPFREECTNLLVSVCCSATHIAYGSIRMEPVFMCLGQAAGIAAAIAEKEGLDAIQDVDYREIQDVFRTNPYLDGTAPDVIVDDPMARVEGTSWRQVTGRGGYGPSYYEGSAAEGSVTFTGVPAAAADYELYIYQHRMEKEDELDLGAEDMNPVTVYELSDGRSVTVDAREVVIDGQTAGAWHKISEVKLDKGEEFSVRVHGNGTTGFIRADAILLVQK